MAGAVNRQGWMHSDVGSWQGQRATVTSPLRIPEDTAMPAWLTGADGHDNNYRSLTIAACKQPRSGCGKPQAARRDEQSRSFPLYAFSNKQKIPGGNLRSVSWAMTCSPARLAS